MSLINPYNPINKSLINNTSVNSNEQKSEKREPRSSSENKNPLKPGIFLSYIPTVKTDLYNIEHTNTSENNINNNIHGNFIKPLEKQSSGNIKRSLSRTSLNEARHRRYSMNSNLTDESFDSNVSNPNINNIASKFDNVMKKLDEMRFSFSNKKVESRNENNSGKNPTINNINNRCKSPSSMNDFNVKTISSDKGINNNFFSPFSHKKDLLRVENEDENCNANNNINSNNKTTEDALIDMTNNTYTKDINTNNLQNENSKKICECNNENNSDLNLQNERY